VMTLATGEFIRRFLIHVLPHGFHRIRHYGLFASSKRGENSPVASSGRRALIWKDRATNDAEVCFCEGFRMPAR
jgi:Putative transposase